MTHDQFLKKLKEVLESEGITGSTTSMLELAAVVCYGVRRVMEHSRADHSAIDSLGFVEELLNALTDPDDYASMTDQSE